MSNGKVSYVVHGRICFFRLEGEVRYTLSTAFDHLIEQIKDSDIDGCVIDLCLTTYIDSTNLGLLAKIAKFCLRRYSQRPLLVSCNEEVSAVLDSMGFDQVFQIIRTLDMDELDFAELASEDKAPDARLLLAAHRNLSELNEKNKDTFRDVIELLESEL